MDATASPVTEHAAADLETAHRHFAGRLAVETDVADVAAALAAGASDFVLVDCRSAEAFAAGHLPGAISLPHRTIDAAAAAALQPGLVVTYCWGPACNAAVKGAARLTRLSRQVKEMLGGYDYWIREGHPVECADALAGARP
jgi:rhodanese-related sulfurtransferase